MNGNKIENILNVKLDPKLIMQGFILAGIIMAIVGSVLIFVLVGMSIFILPFLIAIIFLIYTYFNTENQKYDLFHQG